MAACFALPSPGRECCAASGATSSDIVEQYWSTVPGMYLTGDNARQDEDGYYWIMGRIDDVINVSGHRLSTIEVESALVSHEAVCEAAVVGRPHDLKGQAIAAFVTIRDREPSEELRAELTATCAQADRRAGTAR